LYASRSVPAIHRQARLVGGGGDGEAVAGFVQGTPAIWLGITVMRVHFIEHP